MKRTARTFGEVEARGTARSYSVKGER
jgi:hypothetical protein